MNTFSLVILCALTVVGGGRSENFPSFVTRCKYGDGVCIANVMNEVIKLSGTGNGVPELGIAPTRPYELENVIVEKGEESPINIKIHFKRASITGIADIHVDRVIGFNKDPRTSKFELRGHVNLATISGPYQVSGKVLLLPITGHGWSDIKFEKTKLRVNLKTHVETRNGKDYLSVDDVPLRMDTEKLKMKLENLFNHKELSDNMNAILNENDELIFKELEVPLQNVLGKVAWALIAPVFDIYPYSELFSDE